MANVIHWIPTHTVFLERIIIPPSLEKRFVDVLGSRIRYECLDRPKKILVTGTTHGPESRIRDLPGRLSVLP